MKDQIKKSKKEDSAEIVAENEVQLLSKAESIKPFSELTTIALRQEWEKRRLIEAVKDMYVGCEVNVEELNPRQICFHIDGIKVPQEGYFSVK